MNYKSFEKNDVIYKRKIILFVLVILISQIILFVIISKNSLNSDERIIYEFIKDNGYGYTGGGDSRYGFTVFSKDRDFIGCFNMDLEKIDCDRLPSKLDSDASTWIDEHKIDRKLGNDYE